MCPGRYLTFSCCVLMISVSFLPPMSSSNTHMVTRGSKCARQAALLPTILAMAEPLLGGETQGSGVGGKGGKSLLGRTSKSLLDVLRPASCHPSPPPFVANVPPTTGNREEIQSTLIFAVGEVGQLSDPTPNSSSFSGRDRSREPSAHLPMVNMCSRPGRHSEGGLGTVHSKHWRSQQESNRLRRAFPTFCLLPAHPASLWGAPLPLEEPALHPCPSENRLPVPGADNADFLASHGAASSFSAPAGVGSEYLTPPHVGAAKLRL